VELGQKLVLVNPKTKAEAACRVSGFESSKGGSKSRVEVKFTHPAEEFWGVLFPPENLDPAPASSSRMFGTCAHSPNGRFNGPS
jgi:hypothetical protein